MIGPEPLCFKCKHLDKEQQETWGCSCAAFPDGISDEIFAEKVEHIAPYEGDHGIQYADDK